jgi:hypothetical protein
MDEDRADGHVRHLGDGFGRCNGRDGLPGLAPGARAAKVQGASGRAGMSFDDMTTRFDEEIDRRGTHSRNGT